MTHRPTADGPRSSGPALLLIGLVFLMSRLVVLPFPRLASDVEIYAGYAREQELAEERGVSFYELHAREVERKAEEARAAGNLAAPIDEYKDVEYPPLALAVMRLPTLWMPGRGPPGESFECRYHFAFRAGMAVVDAGVLLLLVVLLRRFFPDPGSGQAGQRLLVYLAGTVLLWHLLYDRLDLLLAALIVLALALLTARLHYGWSFAVLAVGVHLKLAPVVLAPLWVVGSLPAGRPLEFWRPGVLARLGARGAFLLALIVVGFVPFYLWAGERCLGFLAYHRARPVEVGSPAGSLALALRPLAHPVTLCYSYGSVNVHSPLTPALVALSPWLAAGALAAASVLLLVHFRRLSARPADGAAGGATLAQVYPLPLICYALLFLMLFIATNKVFSPQYLLWLAPLVALIPLGRRGGRLFAGGFLLVCLLSTVLVPFLFVSDLIDPTAPVTVPRQLRPPTTRLEVVSAVRNVLFLALTVAVAVHLLRLAREPAQKAEPGRPPEDRPPAAGEAPALDLSPR